MSVVEYVWLGGSKELRSKTKVLQNKSVTLEDLPQWNYDGSSTNQASGEDSEVIIKPIALFKDPFRENFMNGYIVLCDTYTPNNEPLETNSRLWAKNIFDKKPEEKPWYGIEQEYFIIDKSTRLPLGFPIDGNPNPQGQYYCSCGTQNTFGRKIAEEHLSACLKAGVNISGINAEVAPGQWEFQVGPCEGIDSGDHLWMARFLLIRVAENNGVEIDFEPKPVKGNWNGSGCHTNFSTLNMREGLNNKTGLNFINEGIEKLSKKHKEHMDLYGSGNEERMTGKHETASYEHFSHGVANRGASVRIGNENTKNKKGYFEDRRPSSNMDPYLVTGILFKTICID